MKPIEEFEENPDAVKHLEDAFVTAGNHTLNRIGQRAKKGNYWVLFFQFRKDSVDKDIWRRSILQRLLE